MKLNKSIFIALAAVATTFASCSDEGKWDAYDAEGKVTYTFAQASNNLSFSAADVPSEVKIQLYRSTTSGSETLPVTFSANTTGLTGPTSVTFNEGSNVADYVMTVGDLEVGAQNKATVSIAEESVSPSGNAEFALTMVVNYTWSDWGSGTITENFNEFQDNLKVMKADGAPAYRIMAPYKNFLMQAYGYSENEWATFSCPYIEFKIEGSAVKFNTFLVDTYDGSTANLIYGYWPSDLSASLAENEQYSYVVDNTTVQLAPYYYVPGLGGWGVYPLTFTLDSGYNF